MLDYLNDIPITPMTKRYPGISRACLLVALDNGGIHRERSVAKWARQFSRWIEREPDMLLPEIDAWLSGLDDEAMELVCCGGDGEPETDAAKSGAPVGMDDLLNRYFDPGPC